MVKTDAIPQMSRQDTDVTNPPKKVAMLTAGGLAPCLSSAVGALITEYAVRSSAFGLPSLIHHASRRGLRTCTPSLRTHIPPATSQPA